MNRLAPYTTARLYGWVRPKKGNPMSDVIDDPREEEEEDGEEGEEEEEDDEIESWETENGLVFEIHPVEADAELPAHDEVLVIEESDDPKVEPKDVAIALSIDDVDEAIDTLKEIRAEMVKRQAARQGAINPAPKPAAKPRKK